MNESSNTFAPDNSSLNSIKEQIFPIVQSTIASVGIMANLTVIVVFISQRKYRRKIPNIFIINQVRKQMLVGFIYPFNSVFLFCIR